MSLVRCFYCDNSMTTNMNLTSIYFSCSLCNKKSINIKCIPDCPGIICAPIHDAGQYLYYLCPIDKLHVIELINCISCNRTIPKNNVDPRKCTICNETEKIDFSEINNTLGINNTTVCFHKGEIYAKFGGLDQSSRTERVERAIMQSYIDYRIKKVEAKIDQLTGCVEKLITMIEFNPGDGPEFVAAQERFNDNTTKL